MAKIAAENLLPEELMAAPTSELLEVIVLRKECGEYFQRRAEATNDKEMRKSNDSHKYMIKVLEEVFELLISAQAAAEKELAKSNGSGSTKKKKKTKSDEWTLVQSHSNNNKNTVGTEFDDLTNCAAITPTAATCTPSNQQSLHGEDDIARGESDAEESLWEEPVPSHTTKKKKNGKRKQKYSRKTPKAEKEPASPWQPDSCETGPQCLIEDPFELETANYFLFLEFSNIREYLEERWCDYYYDKSITLGVLGVVTNAAFELFNDLEYKAGIEMRKDPSDWRGLFIPHDNLVKFYDRHGGYDTEIANFIEGGGLAIKSVQELREVWARHADWIGAGAFLSLDQHLMREADGKPLRGDLKPVYGPITPKDYMHFNWVVSSQYLKQARLSGEMKRAEKLPFRYPGQTELLTDCEHFLYRKNARYPTAMVFFMQVYMDIRKILEDEVLQGHEQLQFTAKAAIHTLEANIDMANLPKRLSTLWHEAKTHVDELNKYVINDCLLEEKRTALRREGIAGEPASHELHKIDPIWTGVMIFRTKLKTNMAGFSLLVAEENKMVLVMAAMYATAQQHEGGCHLHWPAMDLFIKVHGANRVICAEGTQNLTLGCALRNVTIAMAKKHGMAVLWERIGEALQTARVFLYRHGDEMQYDRLRRSYIRELAQLSGISMDKFPELTKNPYFDDYPPERIAIPTDAAALEGLTSLDVLIMVKDAATKLTEGVLMLDYFNLRNEAAAAYDSLVANIPELRTMDTFQQAVLRLPDLVEDDKLVGLMKDALKDVDA
jgi:hypothetical protein